MDTRNAAPQLLLFTAPARPAEPPRMRRRRTERPGGGRLRMIARLESLAETAEREARDCRRAGDMIGARAARDRAIGARRAAQILQAGPDGVATILNTSHPHPEAA
jgi:hypothetical protein